jgi:SAM-dependent methyltransferase
MNFPSWLAECEPQKPIPLLVEEVNRLYHSFGAQEYPQVHPEIYDFLPAVWRDMIASLAADTPWRVLDFGCGTGFEAEQVRAALGDRIELLVCYDPSAEMLAQCKRRLEGMAAAFFCSRWEEFPRLGPFNLLLTNSVLHHLPAIRETIGSLLLHLSPQAKWIAGHEPSARFYRNPECVRLLDEYRRYRKWKRFIDPASYRARLRQALRPDPLILTAEASVKCGLFKKIPPAVVIDRIVDFHVPHTAEEARAGRGLDFERMQEEFAEDLNLMYMKTYFFLGPYQLNTVPRNWLERASRLEKRFPKDGANFCTVWSRK